MDNRILDLALSYLNEEDIPQQKLGLLDKIKQTANDIKAESKQKKEIEKEKNDTYNKIDTFRKELDQ